MRIHRLSTVFTVLACVVVVGCGSGGGGIPSGLGEFIEDLASSIPQVSSQPGAEIPGPIPQKITGTLTQKLDEAHSDAGSGLEQHLTTVYNVRLKLAPDVTAEDLALGQGWYVDDGSTWTHDGDYRNWINGKNGCIDSMEDKIHFSGNGGFDTPQRTASAMMREDSDIGWNLQLEMDVNDAPGHETATDGCQTHEGDTETGTGILCNAPWLAPATFSFDSTCDIIQDTGSTTLTGSLTGQ